MFRRLSGGLVLLAIVATACTSPPTLPAVRGFEAPGAPRVVAELNVGTEVSRGMLPGSASYVGASVDGSLIGFLTPDGILRWYRVR